MEASKMEKNSSNGLDLFWKLGDAKKEKVRLDMVQKLLNKVVNEEDGQKLGTDYVFVRLVRGMASSRSRGSFFVALTELIRLLGPSCVPQIKKIIEEHLCVKGSKSEEGEHAVGHLFTLGALLRSAVTLPQDEKSIIIKDIFKLSGKRSYLSTSAFAFLKDFIESSEDPMDEEVVRDAFKSKFGSPKSVSSLDQAWISVVLLKKWPSIFANEDKGSRLTQTAFVDQFALLLKDTTSPLTSLKVHPGMHDIIRFLCEKDLAHAFWTKHCDPYLSSDSSYRSSIAFIVLSYIMIYLSAKDRNENITSFISRNFVGVSLFCLSKRNESSEEDKIILGIYESVIKVAEEVPDSQESLLRALLTGTGTITFDKITGGSLISRMSPLYTKSSVKALGEIYKDAVGNTTALSNQERLFAVQQFAKLTSHSTLLGDVEWKIKSLTYLLSSVVFPSKKGSLWNSASRVQAKNAFFKGLDIKEKSFENTCNILKSTLLFASKEIKKSDVLSDESKKIWNKMMSVVKELPFESDKKLAVFLILFAHMGFQLFHQPEMAIDALNDLHICYDKARNTEESSAKKKDDEDGEPKWTEVIVDILLSLLSQNRSILRQVVNTVFILISPVITNKALQMIVDVVNPPSDKDSDDEDDGIETDEDEVDQDSKMDDDEENQDSSSSSESESDDGGEEMEVNDKIRSEVKTALGDFAADSDAGSIDPDDMDEESMKKIDEALAGVFKALCKKKSSGQKKREKQDAIAQIHFRIRALDMIDLYVTRSSSPPPTSHLIYLISPLLNALESALKSRTSQGDTASLITCIKNLLKKIINPKKLEVDSDLDQESLIAVLKMFVGLANRGSPLVQQLNYPVPIFSKLCCFILKVVESTKNPSLQKQALQVYEKSLNDYFCRSHCLLPSNFFSIPINNNREGMWSLASKVLFHTFDTKTRQFRRIQGFNLLMAYIKGSTPDIHKSNRDDLVKSCVQSIISLYNSELTSGTMSKFICQTLSVLKDLYNCKALKETVNWDEVMEALIVLRGKVPGFKGFSELKKGFNTMAVPLKVDPLQLSDKITVNKFEVDDETMDVDGEEPPAKAPKKKSKKKKGKAKKETLISRKQKKSFELDGQFKGDDIPSFKGITSKQKAKFIRSDGVFVS